MKYFPVLLLALGTLHGQRFITTIAGTDATFTGDGKPALEARLGYVTGLVRNGNGEILFGDFDNNLVMKVDSRGDLRVVAGNGLAGFSGDGGPATAASMSPVYGLAIDPAGNLFIATGSRVRRVTTDGTISTFAGGGTANPGDNGPATSARLLVAAGLAVDASGSLYVADLAHRIRRVSPDGIITTVAGNGQRGFSGDGGPAVQASLDNPNALAFDRDGVLYIADYGNGRVRRVTADGRITTFAGGGQTALISFSPVPATQARFSSVYGLVFDTIGNLIILADVVARVSPDGNASRVLIRDESRPNVTIARLHGMTTHIGMAVDPVSNELYLADHTKLGVARLAPDSFLRRVAGSGVFRFDGDGGPAVSALLHEPSSVAVGPSGGIYIADTRNCRVRAVGGDGIIRSVAGAVSCGSLTFPPEDAPALEASFGGLQGIAVGPNEELYISDSFRIRRVTPDGLIRSVVNRTLQVGFSGDGGPAIDARTRSSSPPFSSGMFVHGDGSLYFPDIQNHRIRRVSPDGIITTIAGSSPVPEQGQFVQSIGEFAGDGGPATEARLFLPSAVVISKSGNIYIQDTGNNRIRKITPDGRISTVAGSGQRGISFNVGPAVAAPLLLARVAGLAVDDQENLYISEINPDQPGTINGIPVTGFFRVRVMTPDGIIRPFAGQGPSGFSGDGGPAANARIAHGGIAADSAGNLFIADYYNNRIRQVLALPPSFAASPSSLSFATRSKGSLSLGQRITLNSSVPGVPFRVSMTAGADWLQVTPLTGAAPRLVEVAADPSRLDPGRYSAVITIMMPGATPPQVAIPVTVEVSAGIPPRLSLDKESFSFTYPRLAVARGETLSASNAGDGSLDFAVSAITDGGGSWLSASPATGVATASIAGLITVIADPAGLPPGTYKGRVGVTTNNGDSRSIPVTMTVSTNEKALLLAQTGLTFTAVAGGGVIPPQSFGVVSQGASEIPFKAAPSTLSGGSWLSATPDTGATGRDVEARIDARNLAPGGYYGQVRIDSDGAANTPQVVTAFLEVLPPDADPGPEAQPSELIFTAVAGGSSPGSKEVLVYNRVATLKVMRIVATTDTARNWLAHLPIDAVLAPDAPTRVIVQPFIEGLAPAVHRGTLGLQFSDGRVRNIGVVLIVTAPAGLAAGKAAEAACTPAKLLPAIRSLGTAFSVSASYPVALDVEVRDDCGQPLEAGRVLVSFSNGDPALSMQSLRDGRWQGTWVTGSRPTQQVTLKVEAENPPQTIKGVREVTGDLRSSRERPVFESKGVVNAFGPASYAPLAPGEVVSIFGEKLSEGQAAATSVPLSSQLAGAEAFIALRPMPLFFASDGQLNAMLPFDLEPNTRHSMVVRRGTTLSSPVLVNVAEASPGMVIPPMPVRIGDAATIYGVGLGLVDAPVVAGEAAGASPLAYVRQQVRVTIGGREARVTFAGLAPGYVGLYQVNLIVPEGVPKGSAVPVVVTVAGQASVEATMAIE